MIIIIEHCPSEEMMMETMIPPQVRMRLQTEKREARRPQQKKREIKREGAMLLSFSTLLLQSSTMFFI